MCESHQQMHGDPEAMRRFAEQLIGLSTVDTVAEPGGSACPGGMQACGVFTTAELLSTMELAKFMKETSAAVAELKSAAASAAEDYLATDQAGTQALAVVVVSVED